MTEADIAKGHLRDHLAYLLVPPISEGFWSIQKSATELCERNHTPDQVLRTFQNMLTKIPDWSDVTLTKEVERIQTVTKCHYLDDLIMGVFIAYMKAFASLNRSASEITIDFDRPTLSRFIHEVYIQSARKLWQVAYLFKTVGVTSETQARAHQEVETTINQCMEQVIRGFLPWESITRKYFSEQEPVVEEKKAVSFGEIEEKEIDSESEIESDEESAPVPIMVTEETIELEGVEGEEEDDPIKELEKKAAETLVLNL
jgi:Family of unknown function (DUF5764)